MSDDIDTAECNHGHIGGCARDGIAAPPQPKTGERHEYKPCDRPAERCESPDLCHVIGCAQPRSSPVHGEAQPAIGFPGQTMPHVFSGGQWCETILSCDVPGRAAPLMNKCGRTPSHPSHVPAPSEDRCCKAPGYCDGDCTCKVCAPDLHERDARSAQSEKENRE